jgi:pentatricopeptide repeat protein
MQYKFSIQWNVKICFFWNIMVSGYSQSGDFGAAFEIFKNMCKENILLDMITCSAVISVCLEGMLPRGP